MRRGQSKFLTHQEHIYTKTSEDLMVLMKFKDELTDIMCEVNP